MQGSVSMYRVLEMHMSDHTDNGAAGSNCGDIIGAYRKTSAAFSVI